MSVGAESRSARRIDSILSEVLRPGQDIVVGQAWGAPSALIGALPRHVDLLAGSRLFVGMLVDDFPVLPDVTVEAFFPSGPLGSVEGLQEHNATYNRRSLYEIARSFSSDERHVDVALAQASEARSGAHSLGVTIDFVHAAAHAAETIVVEWGGDVPWSGSATTLPEERVLAIDTGSAPKFLSRRTTPRDDAIAAAIASWIPDGATVQLGMASWVEPLADRLSDRRGLRVHTGLLSEWGAALEAAGAVDSAYPLVAASAAGTHAFYDWLNASARVELLPADRSHDPKVVSELQLLRAVNSVFEVDLAGNVNCEIGRDGRRGGVAGLHDFAVAASAREDALSIIALSATVKGQSRIVPQLPEAAVSLPPESVDVVVTEHGSADLRGLGSDERAEALIAVAAPEHRKSLRRKDRT
jgi:acetyl-CoA hydrolase